jgi:hypothetical protein
MARRRGLAVVDSLIVPRRDAFGFSALPPDFRLTGFLYDDGTFDPIPIEVRDAQTGRRVRLTVIGVLSDTAPFEMLQVPWVNLALVFLTVYAVALVTTLAPARRASHVRPAEALRYQ